MLGLYKVTMRVLLILTVFAFLSCSRQTETNNLSPTKSDKSENSPDFNVALTFINDYAAYCEPTSKSKNDTNWIRNNSLLTDNFKTTYENLINSARKDDPELGLGFDPIFAAQDFPGKGFVMVNSDTKGGFVTVKGKDWPEFVLVLKVVEQDGKSLVDGSGVINIPADKQAKR
jgi:hypothetical protein